MINFSAIPYNTLIGKFLRFPLKIIPRSMIVPILQGPLRGKKWIIGSGIHGYWLGSYEYEKQKTFTKMVKEGCIVYDVGAHVGFYTLLASKLVGSKGKVVAFEPLPKNIYYLKKHLQLNGCNNVLVIEAAVSDKDGFAFFKKGRNSSTGHLSIKGSLKVKTVKIDSLVLNGKIPPPDYIKIDVEGAELKVLLGAKETLIKYYPIIFLSTHGSELHQRCCNFLKSIGYNLNFINPKNIEEIIVFKEQ